MQEFDDITTIADECVLMGSPRVIKKNGGYLLNLIKRIADNYDSTDFDSVSLLADIALAKENCDTIIEAAELCKSTLEKLHRELTNK